MRLNEKLYLYLLPLITSIIIFSWFSGGKIISNTSEENLSIFHAQKYAEHISTFWNPVAMGWKTSFSMPSYPLFAFLGYLEGMNISSYQIQALLLGSLIMVAMFSIFFLIRNVFGLGYSVAFLGSLFYMFNIFSMTQIWRRFIYSHMMVWAYLPLFLLLWIKWIDTGKWAWLLAFLLSSLIFTHAFSNPVFLSVFWTPCFLFVFNKLWEERKFKKNVAKIIASFLLGIILWVGINIWWLYPTLTLGSTWTAQSGQTTVGDLSSLQAVSASFPIWEVLLLRQSWYLGSSNDLYSFYHNPASIIISIIILLIALYGAWKIRTYEFGKYLIWLGVMGLFISKGTNFPLGYTFFSFLFSAFPLSVALRNSYEKFGTVFLLPYTIFFALGLYLILQRFKSSMRYFMGFLLLLLSCGILVYPLWNGDVFPQKHRVVVPEGYIKANDYLKEKSLSNFPNRVFHIPFMLEIEKLSYSWGYTGEDPSDNLFELDPVSKLGSGPYTLFFRQISKHLEDQDFPRILGLMGVKDVILHKDSIYPKIDLNKTEGFIEKWRGNEEKKVFEHLTIYTLDEALLNPQLYAVNSVVTATSIDDGISRIISGDIDYKNTIFITDYTLPNITMNIPNLAFVKKTNGFYKINITGAKSPFILVFNSTFDKAWQARIGKNMITNHILVNGFANGWVIEKLGNYEVDITLKVWPWD